MQIRNFVFQQVLVSSLLVKSTKLMELVENVDHVKSLINSSMIALINLIMICVLLLKHQQSNLLHQIYQD